MKQFNHGGYSVVLSILLLLSICFNFIQAARIDSLAKEMEQMKVSQSKILQYAERLEMSAAALTQKNE